MRWSGKELDFKRGESIVSALHRYTLVDRLGGGAFGAVLGVTDEKGRSRALKIAREVAGAVECLENEIKEDRKLQALHGSNYLHVATPILDDGWVEFNGVKARWYVRARAEGSLDGWAKAHPDPADRARAARAAVDVACWISRLDVAHRDIKPANLLYTGAVTRLSVKATDFGIAQGMVAADDLAGTPGYLPADDPYDPAAQDVYAIGVTVFELITGGLPAESMAAKQRAGVGRGWFAMARGLNEADRATLRQAMGRVDEEVREALVVAMDRALGPQEARDVGELQRAVHRVCAALKVDFVADPVTERIVAFERGARDREERLSARRRRIEELEATVVRVEREVGRARAGRWTAMLRVAAGTAVGGMLGLGVGVAGAWTLRAEPVPVPVPVPVPAPDPVPFATVKVSDSLTIQRAELTRAEWWALARTCPWDAPMAESLSGPPADPLVECAGVTDPTLPATGMTWYEAANFVKRLSGETGHAWRLMTKSDFDAARELSQVSHATAPRPAPVDVPRDLLGNVFEWTSDGPSDDTAWAIGGNHATDDPKPYAMSKSIRAEVGVRLAR